MPVDGIKISIANCNFLDLINSPYYEFQGPRTDPLTGDEIRNEFGTAKYICLYKGLRFIIKHNINYKATLCIDGSLHKYFNQGHHNFNNFTYENLLDVIAELSKIFYFDPRQAVIHNLEIGVNLIPPIKTYNVLEGLIDHKTKRFKSYAYNDAEYYQASHNNFFIKCYNKALQVSNKGYFMPYELMRFENKYMKSSDLVKYLKSKELIKSNFLTLNDLKNKAILIFLGNHLIQIWNEILFYDNTIAKNNLNTFENNMLDKWQNYNYWKKLSKQSKYYQKQKLKELTRKHSNQVQDKIAILIKNKVEELL